MQSNAILTKPKQSKSTSQSAEKAENSHAWQESSKFLSFFGLKRDLRN